MRIERLVLVVVLLCLMVAVSNQNETAAQGGDREATRPYVQVTIGGRSDNYVYYTPDNPNYMRIVDILNKALPIYTTMTGRSWDHQIFVVFMGGNGTNLSVLGRMLDNSSAYVTRREPAERFAEAESCHIRVYPGWVTSSALESEVAYQFFHCIQMSLGAVGILDFGTRENAWWLMGTAEWAASRVYPEQYPKLIHSVFDPRQDITKARLDAYYFWEFASSARGMGNDQNVITQMGVLRTSGLFPLNFGFDSRELFHNWAQVLLNKQLPNPPIIDLTTSDLPAGEGGNYATPLPKFAVDYKNLVGFEIKPGHIGYVQVKGLAGSYAVSVRTANGIQRLADGTPIQFCPQDDGTMIILSRGREAEDDPASVTIEWGQVESNDPCKPKTEEPEDTANCVPGSWAVTSYPVIQADLTGVTYDLSEFVFNFAENGTFTGRYKINSAADGMQAFYDFPFAGTYAVSPVEGSAGTYAVQAFDWAVQPGGTLLVVASDGTATDLTTAGYKAMSDLSLWSPSGSLSCVDNTMTWATNDGTGTFELTRLP